MNDETLITERTQVLERKPKSGSRMWLWIIGVAVVALAGGIGIGLAMTNRLGGESAVGGPAMMPGGMMAHSGSENCLGEAGSEAACTEEGTDGHMAGMMDSSQMAGMQARHHAALPEEYQGLSNPVAADQDSLARGEELYTTLCASCHGDGGQGDGPAGESLDPLPAPLAHTGKRMTDSYLFYRIKEGGAFAPFNSAMPAWKDALDDDQIWDLINYIRNLGD